MASLVEFCRGGKEIAAAKRQRLLPLIQHSALSLPARQDADAGSAAMRARPERLGPFSRGWSAC